MKPHGACTLGRPQTAIWMPCYAGSGVACGDVLMEHAVYQAVLNSTCVPACGAPPAVARCAPAPALAPLPEGSPVTMCISHDFSTK